MQKVCIDSDCDFKAGFVAFDVPQSATHHCNIDNEILHKYHLCCVAYCMFSRRHFICFPKDNAYKRFGFCLRSNFCYEYVITPKGLLSLRKFEDIPRIEPELYWPWVKNFSKCLDNDDFFKLHNSLDTAVEISNYRTDPEKKGPCVYTHKNFEDALKELRRGFLELYNGGKEALQNMNNNLWEVKEYLNMDKPNQGYVKTFDNTTSSCLEMRVMHNQQGNFASVNRCRFVYTYNIKCDNNGKYSGCEGYLYFTNSHYGWDLIPEQRLDETLTKMKHIRKESLNTYEKKINSISKPDLHRLQAKEEIKEREFPFERIGLLTLYLDDTFTQNGLAFQRPNTKLV